jgi:hypothetical protein
MLRYGISSLLLLAALLIGIFYLKPAWDDFQKIRNETDHVRQLSAEFDDLIENREALVAKLSLVSPTDLRKLEALIPQGPQSLEYLIALQQAAQDQRVQLTFTKADISAPSSSSASETGQRSLNAIPLTAGGASGPGQPRMLNPSEILEPKTTIKDLPVGIQISGSYEALKAFLRYLEFFGRLTDISTLTLGSSSSGSSGNQDQQQQGGVYTFSLSLITHYQ